MKTARLDAKLARSLNPERTAASRVRGVIGVYCGSAMVLALSGPGERQMRRQYRRDMETAADTASFIFTGARAPFDGLYVFEGAIVVGPRPSLLSPDDPGAPDDEEFVAQWHRATLAELAEFSGFLPKADE